VKGNYNIIKIDPEYKPEPIERKQVFGVTFEQGRNEFVIDKELLSNVVTENKHTFLKWKIENLWILTQIPVISLLTC